MTNLNKSLIDEIYNMLDYSELGLASFEATFPSSGKIIVEIIFTAPGAPVACSYLACDCAPPARPRAPAPRRSAVVLSVSNMGSRCRDPPVFAGLHGGAARRWIPPLPPQLPPPVLSVVNRLLELLLLPVPACKQVIMRRLATDRDASRQSPSLPLRRGVHVQCPPPIS